MHPDEVAVELPGEGHERLRGRLGDAHLRNLAQEDVAGMHVDAHVAAQDVLRDVRGGVFGHGAVLAAGEDAVHVQVEAGHAARDGIHAQGIERGIDVHDAGEQPGLRLDAPRQLIADVLSLQLVAVGAGDDADARQAARRPLGHEAALAYAHLLVHGQVDRYDRQDQG